MAISAFLRHVFRYHDDLFNPKLNYDVSGTVKMPEFCLFLIKARRGSGFYEMFCIFPNMSCLRIHLVTLFNLPCKNIFVMEYIILCRKTSFLWHAPASQSVYFGEITRVMANAAHLHFFSRYFFAANLFLVLGGCYCRLPARMFIWLVVESISI